MSNEEISPVVLRDKTNMKKSKSKNNLDELENEHKINALSDLNIGDHIVLSTSQSYYCHAILENINSISNIIEIIYYDGEETQCFLNEFLSNDNNESICAKTLIDSACKEDDCKKKGVKQTSLNIDLSEIDIYKVDYEIKNSKCLSSQETIEKARKFIGQEKYNIFTNNDEHFAIYCKTGKAAKLFIIQKEDISAKKIIGTDLGDKVVTNLALQGGQILLVNTAKHIATKFPRSAITAALPAAAEAASAGIGIGIEGISTGYDIYKEHKKMQEGKIDRLKFKKYVAKRVTRGTVTVAGSVAGGIIGQLAIPIPVVGAMVGSLVGGIVGAAVGQGEGILLGELVEIIDNKIKEKKELNEKKLIDEEKPAIKKYHVLDALVIRFKKDILKEENFAHLSDVKVNLNGEDKQDGPPQYKLLKNANEHLNEDDYEIYLLNDSNEIVDNLNLENSFNENGAILNRKSIENFRADQLPSDLNVYFKLTDSDFNKNSEC